MAAALPDELADLDLGTTPIARRHNTRSDRHGGDHPLNPLAHRVAWAAQPNSLDRTSTGPKPAPRRRASTSAGSTGL